MGPCDKVAGWHNEVQEQGANAGTNEDARVSSRDMVL